MIDRRLPRALVLVALSLLSAACSKTEPEPVANGAVTLAITNARVWTGDAANPWAQAIAIRGADRLISPARTREIARTTRGSRRMTSGRRGNRDGSDSGGRDVRR